MHGPTHGSISRRRFTLGLIAAGGAALAGRRAFAAEFELRQFHNQPADSPLHRRLVEMWEAVRTETAGQVVGQVFPENDKIAGGDPAAFKLVMNGGLDFFTLNGGLIGNVVPAMNVQSIPFAFQTQRQVYTAMDGDLGDHLRQEMKAHGIYAVPRGCFENGFQQISCTTKPIRTVQDLQGIRMRTPDALIYTDTWKTLGAEPVTVNFNRMYEALKNRTVDAQVNPLAVVELQKLYEVQKYISMTNHMWAGFNLIANLKMWEGLPAGAQQVIERNAAKAAQLQRADTGTLNTELRTRLAERGMLFNDADTASFRARLGPFYARWKQTIGQRTWDLLEGHAGKLG